MSRSGTENRSNGRAAVFLGRPLADVAAYCTALLALREREAAGEVERLGPAWAMAEDRRRGWRTRRNP